MTFPPDYSHLSRTNPTASSLKEARAIAARKARPNNASNFGLETRWVKGI